MTYCTKCGRENEEQANFCANCGISLYLREPEETERDTCFGGSPRGTDYLSLGSFGIFLLIIGVVFVSNPSVLSDFISWIEHVIIEQGWVRPQTGLINSAITFFSLIGFSTFFITGIRFIVTKDRQRILSDFLTGIALISFAYLIRLYGSYILRGRIVLAIEAVICGLLILLYSVIRYILSRLK